MPDRIIIAALSERRVIGAGDALPWSLPEEYRHFLDSIRGASMVMGRRSYAIFGDDLTSAHNFVLSRDAGLEIPGATVVADLAAAFRRAEATGTTVFVGGGAGVYRQAIGRVDRMYLSWVRGSFEGDAFFPEFSAGDWITGESEDRGSYVLRRYRRSSSGRGTVAPGP